MISSFCSHIFGPNRFSNVMHTESSIMNSFLPLEFQNTPPLEKLFSLFFASGSFPHSNYIFISYVLDHSQDLFLGYLDLYFLLKDLPHHSSASLAACYSSVNAVGSCHISSKTFSNTASCSFKTGQEILSQRMCFFLVLILLSGRI